MVDKLSKIYSQPPSRTIKSKRKRADGDLLTWYVDSMKANRVLNQGNEFFNLFKNCLLQPYVVDGKPALRTIPSDKFIVRATNPLDRSKPTQIVLLMGVKSDGMGRKVEVYQGFTKDEILYFNSNGEIETGMMADNEMDGGNPFGHLPFAYVNRSSNSVMPKQDTDMLAMVKLFPVLLADLSFAIMYQAFSIIYGIDVDDENLKMAPNAFWRMKSEPNSDKTPSIGVIKPQVDISEVLGYISATLSFWLQSRNIRPGAVGQLTAENFSSGVSKMVDEMDTSEDRQRQVEYFRPAEVEDLWPLIMDRMHPYWVSNGLIENTAMFTPGAQVEVNFAEQLPLLRRGTLVADLKVEVEAGFLKKRDAIQKLNPQWSSEEVDAYAADIQAEKAANMPMVQPKQEPVADEEEADDGSAA